MAGGEVADRGAQGVGVERAAQPPDVVHVVGGALRFEAVQEPEALLGGGELRRAAGRPRRRGRLLPRLLLKHGARAPTVGWSNSSPIGRPPRRAAVFAASSEWPPSAKKSSSTPTGPHPSTSAKTCATRRCAGVCGSPPRGRTVGRTGGAAAGRASRSILPLGVSGMASIGMTSAGTM